jgi:hypothetical protein
MKWRSGGPSTSRLMKEEETRRTSFVVRDTCLYRQRSASPEQVHLVGHHAQGHGRQSVTLYAIPGWRTSDRRCNSTFDCVMRVSRDKAGRPTEDEARRPEHVSHCGGGFVCRFESHALMQPRHAWRQT